MERVIAILWESAVESFIRAILVVVCSSIAISIASSIWEEMAPSRPPGFQRQPAAEAPAPGAPSAWETWFVEHRFLIVFGLFFSLSVWFRLLRPKQSPEESKAESHLKHITHHLSENWFHLVVGNAFGALISAVVLVWVQRFTFANLLFHWLLE